MDFRRGFFTAWGMSVGLSAICRLPDNEWLGSGSFYHHFNCLKCCFIPFLLFGS